MQLDFSNVSNGKIKDLQKYMKAHPQDYTVGAIKAKSCPAASMMGYILNLIDAKAT